MTKSKFLEAIKHQRNSVRDIGSMRIAKVDWLNKPWLIVEDNETFEDAKATGFVPIDHFRTSEDLYQTYKDMITSFKDNAVI